LKELNRDYDQVFYIWVGYYKKMYSNTDFCRNCRDLHVGSVLLKKVTPIIAVIVGKTIMRSLKQYISMICP
jgi:hypothetical protein